MARNNSGRKVSLSGVVSRTGSKEFGDKTYYNFTLVDDDTLYKTGTQDAGLSRGDDIDFTATHTEKYGYMVDVDSIEVVGQGEVPADPPKSRSSSSNRSSGRKSSSKATSGSSSSASAKAVVGGKDDYWANKERMDIERQRQISYQAACNTALAILSKEVDLDLVKLGAANAKAGVKMDNFEALLFEKAEMLWGRFNDAATRMPPSQAVEMDEPDTPDVGDDDGDDFDD